MHPKFTPKDIERFWSKVDRSGGPDACWPWMAGRFTQGYGQIKISRRSLKAHRVSWILTIGPIPAGIDVLHRCDNPPCVNPAHLFLGTDVDNRADCVAKGRQAKGQRSGRHTKPEQSARGERQGSAKLTWQQVNTIRTSYAAGSVTIAHLAREYGMSYTQMTRIVRFEDWRVHDST